MVELSNVVGHIFPNRLTKRLQPYKLVRKCCKIVFNLYCWKVNVWHWKLIKYSRPEALCLARVVTFYKVEGKCFKLLGLLYGKIFFDLHIKNKLICYYFVGIKILIRIVQAYSNYLSSFSLVLRSEVECSDRSLSLTNADPQSQKFRLTCE